jgi:UDP-2,3-diacylglucosamine pyrophosphatase LpxH
LISWGHAFGVNPASAARSSGLCERASTPAAAVDPRRLDFRALFVSDVHLGAPGVRDDLLLELLRAARFDALYILGDFVDGLVSKWRIAVDRHSELLHELWDLARRGTKVVYVPGNHDGFARRYAGLRIGDMAIERDETHTTADGRRLWLVHGDEFDAAGRALTTVGDAFVAALHGAHRAANAVRGALGLPYHAYASRVRRRVKTSIPYLVAYERRAAEEARRRGYDGVVCGHLHVAELATFEGIVYANDGDWVDSCTALVERRDGTLAILDWPAVRAARDGVKRAFDRARRRSSTFAGV